MNIPSKLWLSANIALISTAILAQPPSLPTASKESTASLRPKKVYKSSSMLKPSTVQMTSAKTSFIAAQPHWYTQGYNFYSGLDYNTNNIVIIQTDSGSLKSIWFDTPLHFIMGDSNVSINISSTNKNNHYRLKWTNLFTLPDGTTKTLTNR